MVLDWRPKNCDIIQGLIKNIVFSGCAYFQVIFRYYGPYLRLFVNQEKMFVFFVLLEGGWVVVNMALKVALSSSYTYSYCIMQHYRQFPRWAYGMYSGLP